MPTLVDILLEQSRRRQVVQDCVTLIDEEVAAKSGLSGLAIKGAYAVVKAVSPGVISEIADRLLEPFAQRLDPLFQEFGNGGKSGLEGFLAKHATRVANALLGVTDERAARASNATLKKAYEKLRPSGVKHVEAAVPGIARLLAKYV